MQLRDLVAYLAALAVALSLLRLEVRGLPSLDEVQALLDGLGEALYGSLLVPAAVEAEPLAAQVMSMTSLGRFRVTTTGFRPC